MENAYNRQKYKNEKDDKLVAAIMANGKTMGELLDKLDTLNPTRRNRS